MIVSTNFGQYHSAKEEMSFLKGKLNGMLSWINSEERKLDCFYEQFKKEISIIKAKLEDLEGRYNE